MKKPNVELGDCIRCEVCTTVCPSVFRFADSGFIEILSRGTYPEDEVDEAIQNCPAGCIYWEEEEA
ncbi:MAG: ferredoxin [Desulfobacterales bacterium]